MAEPNDEIPKINPSEVEILIKKIEQNTLSEQDKRMIARLLRTLLYLVNLLQEKKVTLLRLKALIFGKKSEKMNREKGEKGEGKDDPEAEARKRKRETTPKRRRMKSGWRARIKSPDEDQATDAIRFRPIRKPGVWSVIIGN